MTTLTSSNDMPDALSYLGPDQELKKALKSTLAINYSSDNVPFLQREGALAVDQLAKEYARAGTLTNKKLLALVLVRLHDLQVRDFAMGITSEANIETLWSLWRSVLQIAPAHYIAPVAALFSATCYEMGDMPMALRALDRALDDDSKYPMAKLLRRVYAAGWPPASFRAMREELHPKVCASLGVASDS
jgi:hypothetical protein